MKIKYVILLLLFLGYTKLEAQCSFTLSPTTASICPGSSASITASNASALVYTVTPSATASVVGQVITLSPLVTTTYTIKDSCSNGTTSTKTITVTVKAVPVASFTSAPSGSCSSVPVGFSNTSTGTGLTFSWNFGEAGSSSNTSTATGPAHTYSSAFGNATQTFNATLVVTNSVGCTASVTNPVTVKQGPNPKIDDFTSTTAFAECTAPVMHIVIDNSSTTQATNTNYSINWGDGSAVSTFASLPATGTFHDFNTLGYFNIVNTVTGANGCTSSQTFPAFHGSNPAVGLSISGSTVGLCTPATLTFTMSASTFTNSPGTSYVVTCNDSLGTDRVILTYTQSTLPVSGTFQHTFTKSSCGATPQANAANTYYVEITATNPCGVSQATVQPITTNIKPVANFSISPDTIACTNSTVTFTNTSTDGTTVNFAGGSYTCSTVTKNNWTITPATFTVVSGSLGNAAPSNNPATWGSASLGVQFTAPGTYTISMIEGNICGNDTKTRTVCIVGPPTPAFTISPKVGCFPLAVNSTNTSIPTTGCSPITYLWTPSYIANSPCATASNFTYTGGTSATSQNPKFNFLNPGVYPIKMEITNVCGTFPLFDTVKVKGPPLVNVASIPNACGSVNVVPSATATNCGTTALTFQWINDGVNGSTSLVPPSQTFSTVATHNVVLKVTNECGNAKDTSLFLITSLPVANAGAPVTICAGASTTLNGTASGGTGAGTYSFAWTGPAGFTSNVANPLVSPTVTSTYSLIVTDANPCTSIVKTVTITVNPSPTVTVNSPAICLGSSATLTAAATGGSTFLWSTGQTINPITVSPIVNTTYTITVTKGGCKDSAFALVTVNPKPIVDAGPSITLCNQPIANVLTPTTPASGGIWTGATQISSTGVGLVYSFTPTVTGNFHLTYTFTDGNGCVNNDTMTVFVSNPQTANAGTGYSICGNDTAHTMLGFTPAGGTWSGTGVVGNTFNPSGVAAGTYNLTYSFGGGTCLSTDTIHVTVKAPPTVIVTPSSSNICAGQSIIMTASGASTYTWLPNTNLTAVATNKATASPTSNITYTVTGTSAVGCKSTATSDFTVKPLTIVDAGSNVTLCNQPIPFTLVPVTPTGGVWTGTGAGAAQISSVGSVYSFTPAATGNFQLTYTATVAGSCPNTDTMSVFVVNPQNANAGNGFKICIDGGIHTLTGFTPAGGTWTGTGIVAGTSTFNPAVAGVGSNYVLTYSFGAGTCLSTDTIHVTVNALPIVGVNSPTICAGQIAVLTGAGANTYTWLPNTNLNTAIGTSVNATPPASTNYTVTGTNTATGCKSTAISTVTVDTLPAVNAGPSVTLCNQAIPYTLTGFSPATGGTWSGVGVTAAGVFTPTGTPAGLGNFTLTYSFTNAASCTNTDTLIVKVITPLVANAGPNDTICLNSGIHTLTGYNPLTSNGGIWTGIGIIAGTDKFDPLVSGVGTFTLTLTFGAGTCFSLDTKTVRVEALPIVNPGVNETTCISTAPYNLSGYTPVGGTWHGTGITNAALGTFSPVAAGVGVYTETYVYKNPVTLCTDSSTKTVEVGALPVVAYSHPLVGCVNAPITFTNTTTGASTYSWNFGDGNSGVGATPSHTYTSPGTYTVHLTAYSPLVCSDSLTDTIQIINPPVSIFTILPDSGCAPVTSSFVNNSTGTYTTFLWNFGNGNTSVNAAVPSQTYQQGLFDTTYIVTLSVTNQCAVSTKTDTVKVKPLPVVNFGLAAPSGCSPFPLNFNNTSTGNASSYVWDFGDGSPLSNAINNPGMHVFTTGANDTTYIIKLVGTNSCGTDNISKPFLVHPNNIVGFFNTSDTTGCAPHTITFTDFSTGATFVSWNFGDGNVSTLLNPVHTYNNAGTYTCQQFTNNGCSYDTVSVVIQINPPPTLAFTSNVATQCANQPVTFTNTSLNSSNFVWDFGDGTTSGLTNPSHSYAAAGTYTVKLTASSTTFLCVDSIIHSVTILALPVPQIASSVPFGCQPISVNFTNNSSNATFYTWNFGDGNISVLPAPSHTYTGTGIFTIKMVAENLNGCKDSMSIQVNSYPKPSADFISSSTFACAFPVNVNFTNNSTNASGYSWDFGDGTTSALTNPSVTYNSYNQFVVQLIASNAFGCLDTATQVYPVSQPPTADFVQPVTSGCQPLLITFTNQSQNAATYSWDFGDGTTSTTGSPSYSYANPGTYTATLIANNAAGCADTIVAPTTITVLPSPTADFIFDQQYTEGGIPNGVMAFSNQSVAANSYIWNFGDNTTSTQVDPQHQYYGVGTYPVTLIATNQFNCKDTVQKEVTPDYFQGLFVPNALMPNTELGDAKVFLPKGKSLKTYRLQIFNTWGTLLFESTELDYAGSPKVGWDGTYEGKPCQQDVYVWKINATFINGSIWQGKVYADGQIKPTGTVTLVK